MKTGLARQSHSRIRLVLAQILVSARQSRSKIRFFFVYFWRSWIHSAQESARFLSGMNPRTSKKEQKKSGSLSGIGEQKLKFGVDQIWAFARQSRSEIRLFFVPFLTFLDSFRSRIGPILERNESKNDKKGTQKSGSLSGIGEQSLNLVYTKFELLLANPAHGSAFLCSFFVVLGFISLKNRADSWAEWIQERQK